MDPNEKQIFLSSIIKYFDRTADFHSKSYHNKELVG